MSGSEHEQVVKVYVANRSGRESVWVVKRQVAKTLDSPLNHKIR